MSSTRLTARRYARKLLLLPVLVVALVVVIAPAPAYGPKWENPGNGAFSQDGKKYGGGDGRKIK